MAVFSVSSHSLPSEHLGMDGGGEGEKERGRDRETERRCSGVSSYKDIFFFFFLAAFEACRSSKARDGT